ncbi:MAG: dihydropteroate synthase [Planctomycetota bacterium]
MEGGEAAAAIFGERAQALEPRALLAGRSPRAVDPAAVDLVFRPGALAAAERELLAGRSGLSLGIPPPADGGGGWQRLRGAREALASAAPRSLAARLLLATHDQATARPGPPRIMGVINATPDSFSDGGLALDPARAVARGLSLVAEGAELLDVGGESTRPGAEGVAADEERRRVLPVIEGLRARTAVPISIDTTKAAVARAALEAGADLVNDVSAGRFDPGILALVAERGCGIVLMHMQGRPRDMQRAPRYVHVVAEVLAHLRERVAACLQCGIALSKIVLDPGIGFGKRLEDNLALLRGIPELRSLGRPILLGVSRKSFLGRLSGEEKPAERLGDTAAAVAAGVLYGAEILRVHDARTMSRAVRVAAAIADEKEPPLPSPRN